MRLRKHGSQLAVEQTQPLFFFQTLRSRPLVRVLANSTIPLLVRNLAL